MKNTLLLLVFIFCAIHVQGQTIPAYVPTNGLVAWYPFNGNANDESGNGMIIRKSTLLRKLVM